MKKTIIILSVLVSVFGLFVGCAQNEDLQGEALEVLKVGATPVPHGVLLELVKEDLASQGVQLEIIEFTDYVKPNLALDAGEIDANFFQHVPYLENFNAEHELTLKSIGAVHVEPLGLYAHGYGDIHDLPTGSEIAIPTDSVNGARALLLLEAYDLIELNKNAGLEATERDIVKNPNDYKFKAIEAAQIPRILEDVDAGIINGNYAIESGINPLEDALILEDGESPYANIITTRKALVDDERITKLVSVLQSDKIKEYIYDHYEGAVVPAF